jgi:hypothetical protein
MWINMANSRRKTALIALVALQSCLFSVSSSATESQQDRASFYLALSHINKPSAYATFLIEQYIGAKCGEAPSIDFLKTTDRQQLAIMTKLRKGDYEGAKQALEQIDCPAVGNK